MKMNFLGLLMFIGLLVAVELTGFSWAQKTHERTQVKDDDGLIVINSTNHVKHDGELFERRSGKKLLEKAGEKCLQMVSVNGKPPSFLQNGNILPICQRGPNQLDVFATAYNTQLRMPFFSSYRLTPQMIGQLQSFPRPSNPHWTQNQEIINQGSDLLYNQYNGQHVIHRGHLASFLLLSYSSESGLSSFSYPNSVPQYRTFNSGQWRVTEGKIKKYAEDMCQAMGGTLYLISGTSQARLLNNNLQVQRESLVRFPSATSQQYINIPNSMWTAGCCVVNGNVQGAFAVMGNNVPQSGNIHMSSMSVEQLENIIRVGEGYPSFTLFPEAPGCYAPNKQYYLDFSK